MIKRIEQPPLKYWSNSNAGADIVDKFNELVDTVNYLSEKLRTLDALIVDIHASISNPEDIEYDS